MARFRALKSIFEFNVFIGYFGIFQGFKIANPIWIRLKIEVKSPLSALCASINLISYYSCERLLSFCDIHSEFYMNKDGNMEGRKTCCEKWFHTGGISDF